MLDTFLNIKTRRVIPTDTKGIFSPDASLRSICLLWKEFLSRGLNCRLLNVWWLTYCPDVMMSPPFTFELKGKHRSKGAFVSPIMLTLLDCCKSSANGYQQCRRQTRVHGDFSYHQYPKFFPTLLPKMWPESVLQNARPEVSFASIITDFCVLPENLTVMEVSFWLFLSWMSFFVASTISVTEVFIPVSRL